MYFTLNTAVVLQILIKCILILLCIANYWQKRISTTMQRFNTKIINMLHKKISRVTVQVATS